MPGDTNGTCVLNLDSGAGTRASSEKVHIKVR